MKTIFRNKVLFSGTVTAGLLIIVLFVFKPCYNTDVDVFFLYMLGGGYGGDPTPVLHYHGVFHLILAALLSACFKIWPWLNWYTLLLLVVHFIALSTILNSFERIFKRTHALIAFGLFFTFIECPLILRFNYSGAALIAAVGGSTALLIQLLKAGFKNLRLLTAVTLLLFLSGLLRIHYLLLSSFLFLWTAFFFLSRRDWIKYLAIHAAVIASVLLAFSGERYYYDKFVPDWEKQHQLHQAALYYSNHPQNMALSPRVGREAVKQNLISILFLYDEQLFDVSDVIDFAKENTGNLMGMRNGWERLYWLFLEIRFYLFLLFVVSLLLFVYRRRLTTALLMVGIGPLLTIMLLILFFKTTLVIIAAVCAPVAIAGLILLGDTDGHRHLFSRIMIFLAIALMSVRLVRIDNMNLREIAAARRLALEFSKNRNILFVDAGSNFNFHFSIWDLPQHYRLDNFIYNELYFSHEYEEQLRDFGVSDLVQQIPTDSNIYLVGDKAVFVADYYRKLRGMDVRLRKMAGFKNFNAYRIVQTQLGKNP